MLGLLKGEKEVISVLFLTLMFPKAMMLKKKRGGLLLGVAHDSVALTPL